MTILSRISRLIGWKPVGAAVKVKIDESTFPLIVGTELNASVVALDATGSFVLSLLTPLILEEKPVQELIAYPRHTGYDAYHILFGGIAVGLALPPHGEQDTRFAIALVTRRKA